ncbi:UPF0449 protein C19orf25 homolog [Fopius arisanus]|uniref:UPF0449 protein C19orf25 homolog n=1 Tax=Fopius arisanus TaxID=64838 RepID=A0A9R1T7U1_9HYME|nr:PREDICTED: UPF0449 protein C19orf25 homolog [Fopius arisanus]XP_011304370.1 PREDICTED: UPF0449 protein C19orf25 homolog [Fopius arisanus]XP_011304371.1 PREDICTED: UPF0449 protein C19orf25 homolog [Fopius arisanus]
MFGNKRKNLPPRPNLPQVDQIIEDLNIPTKNDVAFSFKDREDVQPNLHFPTNAYDVENIYGKARTYLEGNKQLKNLAESLEVEKNELQIDYTAIVTLAQDIRDQAQAVLTK